MKKDDLNPPNRSSYRIVELWNDLKSMKESVLDRPWFYKIVEEAPQIAEHFEALQEHFTPHIRETYQFKDAALELKSLIHSIKTVLLPNLRERLGISFLKDNKPTKGSDHFVHNSMIASVFPQNLESMNKLVDTLLEQIKEAESK